MPFILRDVVNHDGVAYPRFAHVSDELAAAMDREHHAKLTRYQHDDDLCAAAACHAAEQGYPHDDCAHLALAPVAAALPERITVPSAPPNKPTAGEES
jgi:hypothetical protein